MISCSFKKKKQLKAFLFYDEKCPDMTLCVNTGKL